MRRNFLKMVWAKSFFTTRQLGWFPAVDENPAIPFSTQVSKWVLVICRGSLTKGQLDQGATCVKD